MDLPLTFYLSFIPFISALSGVFLGNYLTKQRESENDAKNNKSHAWFLLFLVNRVLGDTRVLLKTIRSQMNEKNEVVKVGSFVSMASKLHPIDPSDFSYIFKHEDKKASGKKVVKIYAIALSYFHNLEHLLADHSKIVETILEKASSPESSKEILECGSGVFIPDRDVAVDPVLQQRAIKSVEEIRDVALRLEGRCAYFMHEFEALLKEKWPKDHFSVE